MPPPSAADQAQPILVGDPNHHSTIQQVVATLVLQVQQQLAVPLNLLSGRAGQLLFLYQAAKWQPQWVDESFLSAEISKLHQESSQLVHDATMATGLPGVAWFYEYLLQDQQVTEDCNQNTDLCLQQHLQAGGVEVEFVLGITGLAPYIGRRLARAPALAQLYLQQIARQSQLQASGRRCWPVPSHSVFRINKMALETAEYNLGFAHGQAGILAGILPLVRDAKTSAFARQLLIEGCDWLLAQRQDATEFGSYFANLVGGQHSSRLAWCYGDLAIALLFARASVATGKLEYQDAALEMARHAASRTLEQAMVSDAWFCHGAAGLTCMFRLLHQLFAEPSLLAAAEFWLSHLLTLLAQPDPTSTSAEDRTSLLSGNAGVGLCLLHALGQAPDWADALLLS